MVVVFDFDGKIFVFGKVGFLESMIVYGGNCLSDGVGDVIEYGVGDYYGYDWIVKVSIWRVGWEVWVEVIYVVVYCSKS